MLVEEILPKVIEGMRGNVTMPSFVVKILVDLPMVLCCCNPLPHFKYEMLCCNLSTNY